MTRAVGRGVSAVGVLLAVLIALVVCPSLARADAITDLGASLEALNSGDNEKAISLASRAIVTGKLRNNLPVAYRIRAAARYRKGQYDQAIADYTKAINFPDITPSDLAATLNSRGNSYMAKKLYDKAIADYDRTIQLDPANGDAYLNRANGHIMMSRFRKALVDLDNEAKLRPDDTRIHHPRAFARFLAGDFPGSVQDFRKVPIADYEDVLFWLLVAEERSGQSSRASSRARKATDELRGWPAPVLNVYLGKATPEQAWATAGSKQGEEKAEAECVAAFFLGHFHLLRDQKTKATKWFRRAAVKCADGTYESVGVREELERMGEATGN